MRRKRLKHAADTLCHMFCGWWLANSYTNLETLGSGTLAIDALSAVPRVVAHSEGATVAVMIFTHAN